MDDEIKYQISKIRNTYKKTINNDSLITYSVIKK